MANGSGGISFQGILTTTKTQLQLSANNSIRAFGAANKHGSNAINVTIYAFPNPNLRSSDDDDHIVFHKSVAANTTELFQFQSMVLPARTHTYEAVASAGSDLILTVYGG